MEFNELTSIQTKTLIDLRQTYEVWHAADHEMRHRFAGSMRWVERNGVDYLMRKIGNSEKGLGRRSPESEKNYGGFIGGREQARERLAGLVTALDSHAAMARSIGLGRVSVLVAKLLRALERARILGQIRIIGTNALFAYESLAGVRFSADALATGDVDLLLDARRRLRIVAADPAQRTVLGLLRQLDHSFSVLPNKPYSIANADGFMVDVIYPQAKSPWLAQAGDGSLAGGNLTPAAIEGLQWLVNCPAIQGLVIDEKGYPAPIIAPDPRVWMVHKMWLSQRDLREPEKKRRDAQQAYATWRLIERHLPLYPLDENFTATLPKPLRDAFDRLRPKVAAPADLAESDWAPPQPKW